MYRQFEVLSLPFWGNVGKCCIVCNAHRPLRSSDQVIVVVPNTRVKVKIIFTTAAPERGICFISSQFITISKASQTS